MKILKSYLGFTGKELLDMSSDIGDSVSVGDKRAIIIPMTMPFANRGEIATKDEATHVCVRAQYDDDSKLVKID